MNNADLYSQGQAEALAFYGAECRDYDQVLWGVAKVLMAAGVTLNIDGPEPWRGALDVSRRWHNELVGLKASSTFWEVVRAMAWRIRRITLDAPKSYEFEQVERSTALPSLWTADSASFALEAEALDRETEAALVMAWRRERPGKRINSREAKEAFARSRERFREVVTQEKKAELARSVEDAERSFEQFAAEKFRAVRRFRDGVRRLVEEVLALDGEQEGMAEALELADRLSAKADEQEGYWERRIAELRAKAA